jgi:hypothetical protein
VVLGDGLCGDEKKHFLIGVFFIKTVGQRAPRQLKINSYKEFYRELTAADQPEVSQKGNRAN